METTITRRGYCLEGGSLKEANLSYEGSSNLIVPGYGIPITKRVANKFIKSYWNDLGTLKNILNDVTEEDKGNTGTMDKLVDDQNVAFTVGKEALLLILAQKDCAGIRFYLAKNDDREITLVAVGVTETGGEPNDLGHGKYIVTKDNDNSDDEVSANQVEVESPISEFCGAAKLSKIKEAIGMSN